MTQSLTLEEFREAYPALTAEEYPDVAVRVRLALAEKFFDANIWQPQEVLKHAQGLYVAHYLTAHGSKASGGTGGAAQTGLVSSKSVDGASVSFDVGSVTEQGAGFWNATSYGRELWVLMRLFGAGAVQI